jgi:5-methylthioribose kinase
MTPAERLRQLRPGQFFLDAQDLMGMQRWLRDRSWISGAESVIAAERAGEGNMNCTLRVSTNERTFILKQARPWVEKYPQIEAPDERALVEAAFYRIAHALPSVGSSMPLFLAADADARMLMLEDLGPAQDFTSVYSGGSISDRDLSSLLDYLTALHSALYGPELQTTLANTEMRQLNHEHIFRFPLRANNGLDLDRITPGLQSMAQELQNDAAYCRRVYQLGEVYLGEGTSVVHGDFFPGSWIHTQSGVRIIDPEFCFFGPPEFDWGVMNAHMHLANLPTVPAANRNHELTDAFCGIEIMRRQIGVAQLPLSCDIERKRRLLQLSRELVVSS